MTKVHTYDIFVNKFHQRTFFLSANDERPTWNNVQMSLDNSFILSLFKDYR